MTTPPPTTPPTIQPSTTAPAGPQPGGTATCFPYPAHDPDQNPHPKIVIGDGVPAIGQKYLDAAQTMWGTEWPGAWQQFAPPASVPKTNEGISEVLLKKDDSALMGGGTLELPYTSLIDAVDKGDLGMWMHESAHLTQLGYIGKGAPLLYAEGITDFIRFVSHGEDPAWKIVDIDDIGNTYYDENVGWNGGYRESARFLLWVTQHYDTSGAKYQLVHDLNVGAAEANPDYQGMFVKATGKTYHELFTEYAQDRKINPHC